MSDDQVIFFAMDHALGLPRSVPMIDGNESYNLRNLVMDALREGFIKGLSGGLIAGILVGVMLGWLLFRPH